MKEYLLSLVNYLWVVDAIVVSLFATLTVKTTKINSSTITTAMALLFSGLVIKYQTIFIDGVAAIGSSISVSILWFIGFMLFDVILAYGCFYAYREYIKPRKLWVALSFKLACGMVLGNMLYVQWSSMGASNDVLSHNTWVDMAYFLGTALMYSMVILLIYHVHQLSRIKYGVLAHMYLMAFVCTACLQLVMFVERLLSQSDYLLPLYRWSIVSINISTSVVALAICLMTLCQYYFAKTQKEAIWSF